MGDRSVNFAFIHGGTVRVEFMSSVLGVLMNEWIGNISSSTAGPLIAVARNNIVRNFLEQDQEWLWMVDTDIVFKPDAIDRLMDEADTEACPVLSALYYVFADGAKTPAAFTDSMDVPGTFDAFREFPEDAPVEAGAVGAGCLLVHRSVFEKIRKDNCGEDCWFREMVRGGREVGEDISFCIRVRDAGFPIYVHTGVRVGHMKVALLGEIS
jgi:hypothetical protein